MRDTTTHSGSATSDRPDMPREVARSISYELMNVLVLLRAWAREPGCDIGEPDDGLTDPDSRANALVLMADERVRQVIKMMEPYDG